jgi:hypothetical protein
MKGFVSSEWRRISTLAVLTFVAATITGTGAGGLYLFAVAFMTIALLIERHQESGS